MLGQDKRQMLWEHPFTRQGTAEMSQKTKGMVNVLLTRCVGLEKDLLREKRLISKGQVMEVAWKPYIWEILIG